MPVKEERTYALTAAEVKEKFGIDLVTAETIRNALWQISRQMYIALMRSAYSGVIRDMMDMGLSLHLIMPDGSCEEVAVTEGCTQFAWCHCLTTNNVLDEWGLENFREGDLVITNDAYRGAIHPSDLNLTGVVFWEGKPVMAIANGAHFMDIGGAVPGGFNMGATTTYEEQLRVPPMLIYAEGVPVRSTFNLILENTRLPAVGLGDLRALCGCLRLAERLVLDLIKAHGIETVRAGSLYTLDLLERITRKSIWETPDGTYEAVDYIDDDGIGTEPIKLALKATIKGDNMEVDFSGSSAQPLGPCKTGTVEGVRIGTGIKYIMTPDFQQAGAGVLHPIDAICPPGSLVAPYPPASVCNHIDIGAKSINLIAIALSKARPERGIAPDMGTVSAMVWGGLDTRPDKGGMPYGFLLIPGGSWGGTYKKDGCSGLILGIGNMRFCVVEYVEQENPVMVLAEREYLDSGGVGKYRGGNSYVFDVHLLAPAFVTAIFDRARFTPEGQAGGGDGSPTAGFLLKEPVVPDKGGITPAKYMRPLFGKFDEQGRPNFEKGEFGQGTIKPTGHFSGLPMQGGETVRFYNASGAGYGDPLERDTEAVRLDVWNGRVSINWAERGYGVIINPDTLKVDEEATKRKRQELRQKRERGEWKPPVAQYKPWPLESLDEMVV